MVHLPRFLRVRIGTEPSRRGNHDQVRLARVGTSEEIELREGPGLAGNREAAGPEAGCHDLDTLDARRETEGAVRGGIQCTLESDVC